MSAFDREGWLLGVRRIESPNHDARPGGIDVSMLVVHAISLPPDEFGGDGILRLFTNTLDSAEHPYYAQIASLRVSAHFLIRRSGELIQFVSCDRRAWHAGVSSWKGRDRCNDYSIGVELEGCDDRPFEEVQYAQLLGLMEVLGKRYGIETVVGHADIAPGRKTDPGPRFDWSRLARVV